MKRKAPHSKKEQIPQHVRTPVLSTSGTTSYS